MDPLADKAIQEAFEDLGHATFFKELSGLQYNLQEIPAHWPESMVKLWSAISRKWSEKEQKILEGASKWSAKQLSEILHLLGFYSLPYCYAAADGAKVLVQSEKILNNTPKRLADTAQFVLDVLAPEAFSPSGKGFVALFKTRLFHAATRYFILNKGQWNPEAGQPINQEDMAGTLLSFSLIVLKGLHKLNKPVSLQEKDNYLKAWGLLGRRLGIEETVLPSSYAEAESLEKQIRERHFRESEEGTLLAGKLLEYYLQNLPSGMNPNWVSAQVRYLLGEAVADVLDIPGKGAFPPPQTPQMLLLMKLWMGGDMPAMRKKMKENQIRQKI
jgi:hypothetical protein